MAPDANSQFAQRLKEAISPGVTQSDFAENIGVSLSGLRKWLSGKTEPGASYLPKIARVTGQPITWLLGEGPEETPPTFDEDLFEKVTAWTMVWLEEEDRAVEPKHLGRFLLSLLAHVRAAKLSLGADAGDDALKRHLYDYLFVVSVARDRGLARDRGD